MRNEKKPLTPPPLGGGAGGVGAQIHKTKHRFYTTLHIYTQNDVGFALKEKKQTCQNQPKKSLRDCAVAVTEQGLLLSVVLIFGSVNKFLSLTERLVESIARPYPHLKNKF